MQAVDRRKSTLIILAEIVRKIDESEKLDET